MEQPNDYCPDVLLAELEAGNLSKKEYDKLVANSTVSAWRDSDEHAHRIDKMSDNEIALHEGKITHAEYNRREKKFYADLEKHGIAQFSLNAKKTTSTTAVNKVQSQGRAKKPARRATRSSAKSGDGNSSNPDPDPERPRQLYTFKSFAQLVDCSEKTLRNKVSAGLFPQPQKTAFGPRFTQQHLDYAVTPAKPPKTRGRPRIADLVAGGVQ